MVQINDATSAPRYDVSLAPKSSSNYSFSATQRPMEISLWTILTILLKFGEIIKQNSLLSREARRQERAVMIREMEKIAQNQREQGKSALILNTVSSAFSMLAALGPILQHTAGNKIQSLLGCCSNGLGTMDQTKLFTSASKLLHSLSIMSRKSEEGTKPFFQSSETEFNMYSEVAKMLVQEYGEQVSEDSANERSWRDAASQTIQTFHSVDEGRFGR